MKLLFNEVMEFTTPCFCAGADQSQAEIRAPSLRGELRWWFRALGGSRREEQEIFGGIAGETGTASAIVVRVSEIKRGPSESRNLPANHRFFTMSRKGEAAMIPEGRQFRLQLLEQRSVATETLTLAIEAMTLFGSIGLRSNRGCGAFQPLKKPSVAEVQLVMEELKTRGFSCFSLDTERDAFDALSMLEERLKKFRDDCNIKKNGRNAMGYVEGNQRHSSCLRVRPLELKDGSYLPLLIYTEAAMADGVESIQTKLAGWFA